MSKPNILFLTVDCLRYDRCGFNGYTRPTTPTLTELARSSLVFDDAVATGPYTPESVPGFLAGLHGYNSAYYSDGDWTAIPNDAETARVPFPRRRLGDHRNDIEPTADDRTELRQLSEPPHR